MAVPAVQSAILGAVAPKEVGKASGVFNKARFVGGAFGGIVVAAVMMARGMVQLDGPQPIPMIVCRQLV